MQHRRLVTHIITGLSLGGAEMMLLKLVTGGTSEAWSSRVISLRDTGEIGRRLSAAGIPVKALAFHRSPWKAARSLRSTIAQGQPSLLQGWMYHGNIAALIGRPSTRLPVVWNIRQSFGGYSREKLATAGVIRVGAALSSRAARIVYNSRVSAGQHEALGYDPRRTVIIPNGFDLSRFRPREGAGVEVRRMLGLPLDSLLVGHIARLHPMKDHKGLLQAAAQVTRQLHGVVFLLAGTGVDLQNATLRSQIEGLGLGDHVRLLGPIGDTDRFLPGLDVVCQSSRWGEGFPNILGEAMSCGVPCVATDVGDSAWLIGNAGSLVQPGDPVALARALLTLLRLPSEARVRLGNLGRERIAADFDLRSVSATYSDLYQAVLDT